jgi:gamma-glutamyltranspeptidase/glutathione hydrolase
LLLGQSLDQAAADYTFQSISFNNSFWPRESVDRGVLLERSAPRELARDLKNRGHRIFDVPESSLGRLSIVARATHTGNLGASVSPRSGYALAALG